MDATYLGFHFVEGGTDERDLGKGILEFLVSRYLRTNIGKSAKNKLQLLAG